MFFDRKGNKLTLDEWANLTEDVEYRRVAGWDHVGEWSVSTVWIGISMDFNRQAPVSTFETWITGPDGLSDMVRYSTEEDALEGHRLALERCKRQEKTGH